MTTRWLLSLCPTLVTGRTRSVGKILFLDCPLHWMCQKKHERFVLPSFILPYPYPLDTSEFLQHHSLEVAFTHKWGDPKEGAWSRNPNTRRHGAHGAFQSSSSPEAPHPAGAVGMVSLQEDPLDLEVVGPCRGEQACQVHGAGLIGWYILLVLSAP